ncbi:hypothetical protein, partial [Hallella sp.]|uniref:hypothetical protein n=1 Tax=Hallella sp. TaxID=2980186 RepID=UPI00307CA0B5
KVRQLKRKAQVGIFRMVTKQQYLSDNPHLLGINGAQPFDGPPHLHNNNLLTRHPPHGAKTRRTLFACSFFLPTLKKGQAP